MTDNHVDVDSLFGRFLAKETENPLYFGEKLAKVGTDEVRTRLLNLLDLEDMDDAFLAVKALLLMPNKEETLERLLSTILRPANRGKNGGLVSLLEEFDLGEHFVDIFRIFLFGTFKASTLAKGYLDYMEFEITPRTLKKVEKHWNHFLNNASNDDSFELKKMEGEEIIQELKDLLSQG
ncbi:hypothetical protein ADIS_1537 [Lunatimonas lonarensis]|uniref:Uncharacterized protein n=1 Tax=Lunatimonas lonarensis TaxID=1232681 RepID=R7ZVD6_9BACT|nr:hypothetical protein [Lunatimonas lonarensis]EON77998.1 hypothetical protein ADIS_1537 [Lunatimonas lonarensis]